jgi:hypothetical protein
MLKYVYTLQNNYMVLAPIVMFLEKTESVKSVAV